MEVPEGDLKGERVDELRSRAKRLGEQTRNPGTSLAFVPCEPIVGLVLENGLAGIGAIRLAIALQARLADLEQRIQAGEET